MASRKATKSRQRKLENSKLNELISKRLKSVLESPVLNTVDETTKISDIIKTPDKTIETGKLLKDNIKIDDSDKAKPIDLIDLIKPDEVTFGLPEDDVIVIDKNQLDEENQRRLFEEERERRLVEDERWADLKQSFIDDKRRREEFIKKIALMKKEFDLYLKEKYPDIVGDKSIKTEEIVKTKEEILRAKALVKKSLEEHKRIMIERLDREKLRKVKEGKFKINIKEDKLVSTFLEEEIVIEQQEKLDRNPEIEGLNPIEKQIKDMKRMEKELGRPIIPHRDIVESNESDFDTDTETDSTDILIKPGNTSPFENYEERREPLERLRKSLSDGKGEDDFIVKMDKSDRKELE
jgi:hypothetical protein